MKKMLFAMLVAVGFFKVGQAEASIQGYLDVADCNSVAGWAWDTTGSTVPVSISVDGTIVGSEVAENFRPDLLSAGIGSGYHGFSFPAFSTYKDGRTHTVTASAYGVDLINTKSVTCGAPNYQGYLDAVNCDVIAGWAWNSSQPNTPINVTVVSNGAVMGMNQISVPAGLPRGDLLAAGIGNGNHAFAIPTPDALKDGVSHAVVVYAPNGTPLFNDSGSQAVLCNK